MESYVTVRAIALGSVLFVGICIPLLFAHYSRAPRSRLPGWVPGLLAIGLAVFPAYRYVEYRRRQTRESTLTGESTNEALLYELSPTLYAWLGEPVAFLVAGGLLGSVGFLCYGILAHRRASSSPALFENGQ